MKRDRRNKQYIIVIVVLNKDDAIPQEENKVKAQEYREKNREEIHIKQNEKAECPMCKCMIRKQAMNRHEQSIKHQMNINGHNIILYSKKHNKT